MHHTPQVLIRPHLLVVCLENPFRVWLLRRLAHMLEHAPAPGELDLMLDRLRWLAQDVPPFVVLAFLRFVANSWPTPRRMTREPGTCLFGCHAVGGDDVRHYVSCPRLALIARQRRRQPPVWRRAWHMRIACHVIHLNRSDTALSGVWHDIV